MRYVSSLEGKRWLKKIHLEHSSHTTYLLIKPKRWSSLRHQSQVDMKGILLATAPKNSQVFWQIQLRSFHHLEEGVERLAIQQCFASFFFGGFSTWKCIPLKTQVHGEFKWKMVNQDDIIVSFLWHFFFFLNSWPSTESAEFFGRNKLNWWTKNGWMGGNSRM